MASTPTQKSKIDEDTTQKNRPLNPSPTHPKLTPKLTPKVWITNANGKLEHRHYWQVIHLNLIKEKDITNWNNVEKGHYPPSYKSLYIHDDDDYWSSLCNNYEMSEEQEYFYHYVMTDNKEKYFILKNPKY